MAREKKWRPSKYRPPSNDTLRMLWSENHERCSECGQYGPPAVTKFVNGRAVRRCIRCVAPALARPQTKAQLEVLARGNTHIDWCPPDGV